MSIPKEFLFRRRLVVELRSAPRALFWLGVLWFILGTLITFYPGSEQGWFAIAGTLTAFGFLVPQQRYRIAALTLVALSLLWIFTGHQRSTEYQHFLEHGKAVTSSPTLQP